MNPLKPKLVQYLETEFLSQRKHNAYQLQMLTDRCFFKEIITTYSENCMEPIYALCEQNAVIEC